jgi:hypothetical protein
MPWEEYGFSERESEEQGCAGKPKSQAPNPRETSTFQAPIAHTVLWVSDFGICGFRPLKRAGLHLSHEPVIGDLAKIRRVGSWLKHLPWLR